MKRWIVLAIAMWGTLTVGGAAAADKSTYDLVKERGVMRAGVKNDAPLFAFVNEKGDLVGFEIDLLEEIAKRLKVKLETVKVSSATRIPMLQSGRVDIVAATMSHYRKREEVIDFTIGHFNTPMSMLVRKDSPIKTIADMKGKIAGFNVGSGALKEFQAIQPNAQIKTFQGLPEAFLALQQGLVDAMPTDMVLLAGIRASVPNPNNYVLLSKTARFAATGGEYAMGVPPNDSKWRNQVNYLLQDMWLDGTWERIFDKWMGAKSPLKLKKEDLGFEMVVWSP